MERKWYILASVGLVSLSVILILALAGVWYFRKHGSEERRKRQMRRGSHHYKHITPAEPPKFVIPPYATLLADEDDASTADSEERASYGKASSAQNSPKLSPVLLRSVSSPNMTENVHSSGKFLFVGSGEKTRDTLSVENGHYSKRVHSLNLSPGVKRAKRKTSVAPYGKLQTTVKFASSKLIIQVNGTFDLPQVRMSGVSTPYVRVHLLPGDKSKEARSHFMNLASNRMCAFDRITIEEARKSTLKFVVLDYDKFSRSEFLAEMMLALTDINLEEGDTVKRHLNSKERVNDESRGSLLVSLCQQPASGQLTVIIMKAQNLSHSKPEQSGGIDVHVKVSFLVHGRTVEKRKTKVQKKTLSPIFNEAFVFDMMEEDLSNSSVVCEVIGDFVLKSERIGQVTLGLDTFGAEVRHWNELMMSPQKQIAEWHPIQAIS